MSDMPKSEAYNMDCLAAMREMPDNAFDLAIVDPPYGIGEDGSKGVRTSPSRPNSYHRKPKHKPKGWDKSAPGKDYFIELLRISKNVIIFGANHFIENIPSQNTPCWIVWDKKNEGTDFADCELAWSNMKTAVRKFTMHKFEGTRGGKDCIHPTQKPIALYKWLLQNYAKQGDRILDTHLGSGSSRIAAYDMGFDFVGYELDAEYFDAMSKRFAAHISRPAMFAPEQMYQPKQSSMF